MKVRSVLHVLVAGATALAALAAAVPHPQPALAAPNPQPGSWPYFRYDLQRTNRVPPAVASSNITQPAIKWSYPVGGLPNALLGDITGPNGLPDGQPEVITWGSGRVRAFKLDGSPLWTSDVIAGLSNVVFLGSVDANASVEVVANFVRGNHVWGIAVLEGASGAVLSSFQDSGWYGGVPTPFVGDINGDGVIEFFHQGFLNRYIYSFSNGAAQPPTSVAFVPSNSTNNQFTGSTIGDLDGDGQTELVMPFHRTLPPSMTIVSPHLGWSVVTRTIAPYPPDLTPADRRAQMIVTDTVVGGGQEFLYIGRNQGAPYGLLIHGSAPSPSYTVTANWHYTFALVSNLDVQPVDLVGTADKEVLVGYVDSAGELRSMVIEPINGATVVSETGALPCFVGNLDGDAYKEVVFCDRRVGGALQARAYKLAGATWQPMWPVSITIYAVAGTPAQLDLNGDGIEDLLAYNPDRTQLRAYSGANGALLSAYTFPAGQQCFTQVSPSFTLPIVLSCPSGFVYLLDNTLNATAQFYAGTGTTLPYVVDTDANGNNEVVFAAAGRLVNLSPLTATQQQPPLLNWTLPFTIYNLPSFWHPLNVDGASQWVYPLLDSKNAPTYTVVLLQKHPATAAETVVASGTLYMALYPSLIGMAQLNGGGGLELVFHAPNNPVVALHQTGGGALGVLWSSSIQLEPLPAAVWDVDSDGRDELFIRSGGSGRILDDDGSALTAGVGVEWAVQPVIANVDADPAPEFLLLQGDNSAFGAFDLSGTTLITKFVKYPGLPVAARNAAFAVADAENAANGLDIIAGYGNGLLYAYSGITGSEIYSRALGVAFNTGTCVPDITSPVVYPGTQVAVLESVCRGAAKFAPLMDVAVADIDGDGRDELLVASSNGYLYALNAENGTLLWGYNFYYPVSKVIAANVDSDPQLEVLVSVADGFLYALDQRSFIRPQSAWDGPSPVVNDDVDVQASQTCYSGHWRATSDSFLGQPQGYRVALRDEGGALLTDGYLNVAHLPGATVMGVTLCYNDPNPQRRLVSTLLPGRRYFLEVISYKGANASDPTFTDGVLIAKYGSLEGSEKLVSPSIVSAGGTLTWQIVVRNSAQAASAAQVIDPIPINTTFVPGTQTATFGPTPTYNAAQNQLEWSATLAPGQVATITFQTQVNAGFSGGLIRNTAQIINLDNGLSTYRSASASVGASNLSSAVKQVDKTQAQLNDVLSYTIRLTNTGTLTASGTLVDDSLPSGVSFVAGSLSASGGSGVVAYDRILKRVIWNGSLAPGQTLQVQFRVKVNVANAILDNCAQIQDVLNGSFRRCARTIVGSGAAALEIEKVSDRNVYSTTDTIVYTITLHNNGTQSVPIEMYDPMPSGVVVQSAGTIPPTLGGLSYSGNWVKFTGSLAPGDTVQVRIFATLNRSDGVLLNRAVVTNTVTNRVQQATREVLVGTTPAINMQKFALPASVNVGDEITYVLRLENTGNMDALSAVVTDALPSGTGYVAGSAQANFGTVTYNSAASRLQWSGPVYLTATTFITWRVQALAGTQVGFPIVNTARSFDGQSDYDEAVALTPVNVPAGKALIRVYVYSGSTGTTPMSGVAVSAAGLSTVVQSTDGDGYAGLLVDAIVTPTGYAIFQTVPSGYVNLTPNPVGVADVTSGGVYDVVMRNAPQAPSGFGWVRGVVFNDENQDGFRNVLSEVGLGGVSVAASTGATTQTLDDGSYFFLLPAGARTITQTNLAGWRSSTPDVVVVNVTSGGVHEVNFGDWLCASASLICEDPPPGQARIYGYVYRDADAVLNAPTGLKGVDDEGLPLIEVWANVGVVTDVTDASGLYVLDVPAGLVSVQLPTPPSGYVGLSPLGVGLNAPAGGTLRVDFAVVSSTVCSSGYGIVSGHVFSDTLGDGDFIIGLDEPTLTEASVTLGSQTQHTNWAYAFVCVPVGNPTVQSTNPPGYTNTTPNSVSATVSDGQTTQVDFGKAFQGLSIRYYAYVPIVRKQP